MMEEGGTTYQCPDCGQARTGGECGMCWWIKFAANYLRDEEPRRLTAVLRNLRIAVEHLLAAFKFQRERAEKAERELEEAQDYICTLEEDIRDLKGAEND